MLWLWVVDGVVWLWVDGGSCCGYELVEGGVAVGG